MYEYFLQLNENGLQLIMKKAKKSGSAGKAKIKTKKGKVAKKY